jgi:hypothetical protein
MTITTTTTEEQEQEEEEEAEVANVISPCPGCRSDQGAHVRILKRPRKKSKSKSKEAAEEKGLIQNRRNLYKLLPLYGLPIVRNPSIIINPQKPGPRATEVTEDDMREFAQSCANWWKMYDIPFEIAPSYFQKHPEAWHQMKYYFYEYVLPTREILDKMIESMFDDRCSRSLLEWAYIIKTGLETSYYSATGNTTN